MCSDEIKFADLNLGQRIHWGHVVAWLVEALCYKPQGHGFESLRGQ
jgi:hypothetical protein